MLKAIGAQVIVKIIKRKSAIDLSAATSVSSVDNVEAIVESLGTQCTMGVKPGHKVMFKVGTLPIEIESTDEHQLLLVPEASIAYVSNWEETE